MNISIGFLGLLLLTPAQTEASDEPKGFGWGAIPAVNYNSDDGFGYGAIGNLYWYEKGVRPYKYSVMAQFFMTTKWVQIHRVKIDALDVAGLPLRLWGEAGYYSTFSRNYCGVGNQVSCDPAVPTALADERRLTDEARDDFIRHYYQFRFIQPYGFVNGRWRLTDLPDKVEVMAGWRGTGYIAGEWGDLRPYPGSLYAEAHPEGEGGFASVLQLGVMLDNRDNEPAPTKGYWVEASLRGSSNFIGSSWSYLGANLQARGYLPLSSDRKVVLASQFMIDATAGDMPVEEIVRVGGSIDRTAVGGEYYGRGIRMDRYIGHFKTTLQTELRWMLVGWDMLGQHFDLTTLGFMDAGTVGYDWDDWRGEALQVIWGGGGGLRLAWNKNFIIRLDVAASPFEAAAPGVYINLNHIF